MTDDTIRDLSAALQGATPLAEALDAALSRLTPEPEQALGGEPCPRCAGRGYVRDLSSGIVRAQVCGCSRSCLCDDGQVYSEVDGRPWVRPCPRCAPFYAAVAHLDRAHLPAEHADARLDAPCADEGERLLRNEVARRVRDREGFGLVGPAGTGKTWLLVAALRAHLRAGLSARYVTMPDLFDDARRRIGRGGYGEEHVDQLALIPVLALDELGNWRGTDFECELFARLVDKRYRAKRLTLAGSNYGYDVVEETLGRWGGPTRSRLEQMCPPMPMGGGDRRRG